MYLNYASVHLLNILHTTGMSQISAKSLNHYTMVYDLNFNRLKENSRALKCLLEYHGRLLQWYPYCQCWLWNSQRLLQSWFWCPEAPVINEVQSTKESVPCFKYSGPHFQCTFMKNKGHPTNKFQKLQENQQASCVARRFTTVVTSLNFITFI